MSGCSINNKQNKDIKEKYSKLFSDFTMRYVWEKNGELPLDKTRIGGEVVDSPLYQEILQYTGNETDALRIMHQTFLTNFEALYPRDENKQHSFAQVQDFLTKEEELKKKRRADLLAEVNTPSTYSIRFPMASVLGVQKEVTFTKEEGLELHRTFELLGGELGNWKEIKESLERKRDEAVERIRTGTQKSTDAGNIVNISIIIENLDMFKDWYESIDGRISIETEDEESVDSVTALTKDRDVSQSARATKDVIQLVASLPSYRRALPNEVNPETNQPYRPDEYIMEFSSVTGLPMSGNFASNWNVLTNTLTGIQQYTEMYNKIAELAEQRPQFQTLLARLPDPTKKGYPVEGKVFGTAMALRSIMSNPEVAHYVVNQQRNPNGTVVVTAQQKGLANIRNPIRLYDSNYFVYQKEDYVSRNENGDKFVNLGKIVNDFDNLFTGLGASLGLRRDGRQKDLDYLDYPGNQAKMAEFLQAIGLGLTNTSFAKAVYRDKYIETIMASAPGLKAIFEKLKLVHQYNSSVAKEDQIEITEPLNFILNPAEGLLELGKKLSPQAEAVFKALITTEVVRYKNLETDKAKRQKEVLVTIQNYLGKKQTELAPLLAFFDSFEIEFKSGSYLNAEDKRKFSRNSWFYLTQQVAAVNKAGSYKELIETPGFEHFDYRKNPDILGSVWMSRLFGLPNTPDKIKDLDSYKKKKNTLGQPLTINIGDFGGLEIKESNGSKSGFTTTNLHPDDKMMQDIFYFFQKGTLENLRFGDKSSSFFTYFNDGQISKLLYIPLNLSRLQKQESTEDTDTIPIETELVDTFKGYLISEVKRKIAIEEEIAAGREPDNFSNSGRRLFVFQDIIPAELYDKMTAARTREEITAAYQEIVSNLPKYLSNYFDGQAELLLDDLVRAYTTEYNPQTGSTVPYEERLASVVRILNSHSFVNLQLLEAGDRKTLKDSKKDKIDVTPGNVKYLMSFFAKNAMVNNIEFMKFFVGDIANFQKTGKDFREVFKRIPFTSTPGNPPIFDEFVKDWFSLDKNQDALSVEMTGIENPFNNTVRTVIYNDVNTFSKQDWETYKAAYDKLNNWDTLKQENSADFEGYVDNPKEADGQGAVTLDFYRNYLITIGKWDWDKQEPAYENQVRLIQIKNLLATNPENRAELEAERDRLNIAGEVAPFPPLKLGHYGPIVEDAKRKGMHKFSLVPIIPSVVADTQLEKVLVKMYESRINYYTFKSGSKASDYGKAVDFYKTETVDGRESLVANDISDENVTTLHLQNLREQQYQAPKYKGEATLSTQMVKLIFGDFFQYGELNDAISDVAKQKIPAIYSDFKSAIKDLVEFEQYKLEKKLGIRRDTKGNIVEVDQLQMAKFLTKEIDKKASAEVLRDYIKVDEAGNFVNPLDPVNQRAKIEEIILSVVNKKIIKQKLNGESYIQVAGTGFETRRFKKPTAEELEKYGAAELKFYGIDPVTGETTPMEVKVGFNPAKHSGLLELTYEGKKIGTLNKLNEILKSDSPAAQRWRALHKNKITMVGVRIPVQGPQTMEYTIVKEFLPTSAGPIMILPAQIVTKSGGDYDIDKLTFFETSIDRNGKEVTTDATSETYKEYLDNQREIVRKLQQLKALRDAFEKEVSANPAYSQQLELRKQVKQLRELTRNNIKSLDEFLAAGGTANQYLDFVMDDKKAIDSKVVELSKFVADNNLTKSVNLITEVSKSISKLIEESKELSGIMEFKKAATNRLINSMKEMMKLPDWYGMTTTPNTNDVLTKDKPFQTPISSTDLFNPRTSWRIYRENILSKDALGIDAKINTMQKEFQLANLKFINPFLTTYYFKANKNEEGHILLGGIKDADGENKISKIYSEMINGHVDIAKEDWIILLGMDNETSPIAHAMILNGTPIKDVLAFLKSEPIKLVRSISEKGELFKSQYESSPAGKAFVLNRRAAILKLVANKLKRLQSNELKEIYQLTLNTLQGIKQQKGKVGKATELSVYVNIILNSPEFNQHITNFNPNAELTPEQKEVRDIAYLLQFGVIQRQQERLRELTSNADFNTENIRTSYSASIKNIKLSELADDFNLSALQFMFQESALSQFNSNGFVQDIMEKVFPLTDSPEANNSISTYISKFNIYKDEDVFNTIQRFKNNLLFTHVQLFAQNENGNLMEYYRGEKGLFVHSTPNNIKNRYEDLLIKYPHLKDNFLFANLQLDTNNPNSREIIFKLKNSDVDEVGNDYKLAFEEGMNHKTEEISAFFKDLALGSYMQFGPHFNSGAVSTVVPPSAYLEFTNQAYSKLLEMKNTNPKEFQSYLGLVRYNTRYIEMFKGTIVLSPSFSEKYYGNHKQLNEWVGKTIEAAKKVESRFVNTTPAAVPATPTQTSTSVKPKGTEVKEGIFVNQDGLTQEEELELFNLIKPALENQAVRSNKGKFAPKMTGLNLNWDYVSNRRGKQKRVDVGKSLRPNDTYGWFTLSANEQKLYPITGRIVQLMSKATGIDVTNYDGAILNIYDQNSFIGTHPDIDESVTAKNYPVVVVNLGGTGNIVLGTDKDYVSVDLKSGSAYLFGFEGKNRTIPHSTYASSIKGTLPALTTKIDGQTYEAGSYRVTVTMRRVMPLEPGMPTSPSIKSTQPIVEPFKFTHARTADNSYEVSTAGDKRFSALNAKLKDGRTIEEAYQKDIKSKLADKDMFGEPVKSQIGKGKVNPNISYDTYYTEYKKLWEQWAKENPQLIEDLRQKAQGKVLTDKFASSPVSQARALADILNETITSTQPSTQPITQEGKFSGKMTYSYGNNKRGDVTADNTFDAILRGERTATTRYESQGNLDYWKQAKVGDIITWESADGRKVNVVVTRELHKLQGSGKTPAQWSKLEGWSVEYFNSNVKPKINEAWQIEFKLVEPGTQATTRPTTQLPTQPTTETTFTLQGKTIKLGRTQPYINNSGAARGADAYFNFRSSDFPVSNMNWHNQNMLDRAKQGQEKDLITGLMENNPQALITDESEYAGVVQRGATRLGKTARKTETINKLGRNWFQVKNSDAVFAIVENFYTRPDTGELDMSNVAGGTGWAVAYAAEKIDGKERPIYVFNQADKKWYEYDYVSEIFKEYVGIPKLTPNFAGIGTRKINNDGKKAIDDLFENTFGAASSQQEISPEGIQGPEGQVELTEAQIDALRAAEEMRIRREAEQERYDSETFGTDVERLIADMMPRMRTTTESLKQYLGERIYKFDTEFKLQYVDNKKGKSLDALSEEVMYAVENKNLSLVITDQDIVDFMTRYPGGVGTKNSKSIRTFYGAHNPKLNTLMAVEGNKEITQKVKQSKKGKGGQMNLFGNLPDLC